MTCNHDRNREKDKAPQMTIHVDGDLQQITFEILMTTLVVVMWFEFCNQYQVVVGLKENKGSLGSFFNGTFAEYTLMAIRK